MRGFTLMELAVSIAIAGIVTAVAASLYATLIGSLRSSQIRARLTEQANASLDYLLEEAARASGPGVPARSSVIIEESCAARGPFPDCDGTDRLTIVQPLHGYRVCPIISGPDSGSLVAGRLADGRCCLADTPTADNGSFKRQMMLAVGGATPIELPVFMTLDAPGSCTFRYEPLVPPAQMPRPLAPGFDFAGGTAQMVDVKTFYLEFETPAPVGNSNKGVLVMHSELDGDLGSAVGERLDLAQEVHDLQFTIGFRNAGASLVAVEDAVSPATDDWAFNDPAGDTGFDYDTIAMVGASVIVAARDTKAHAHTLAAPWGPDRRVAGGLRAMTASGRIGLRALASLNPAGGP